MTTLRTWCTAMERAPRCMITLSNMAYDVVEHRYVPRDVMRTIVDRVVAVWSNTATALAAVDGPDHASDLLSRTLDSAEEDLFCRGQAVTVGEQTSSIVDGGTLEEFYIRNTYLAKAIKPRAAGRRRPSITLTPERIKPRASVRGRRPFAWATKTSAIDDIERNLADTADIATRVRDYLGLEHQIAGRELFEIRYPAGALLSARVAAPTFIEGACREVYRSNIDASDGWGRAVDLAHARHEDGGPEMVHTPIPFSAAFTLHTIGVVASTRACSETTLENACPRRWESADVERVEDYIASTR